MSLRHIVMWRVRGDDEATRAANAQRVKREFESLAGCIPGLLHLEVGIDVSRIDYACDVVLFTEFDSAVALAAYATHPEHLRVRNALGDLRTTRHQVDYQSQTAVQTAAPPPPVEPVAADHALARDPASAGDKDHFHAA